PLETDKGVVVGLPYGTTWDAYRYLCIKRTRVDVQTDYLISVDSAIVNAPGSSPLYEEFPKPSPSIRMSGNAASAGGQTASPSLAHNRAANALFLDCHAESCDFVRLQKVRNQNTTVAQGYGLSQRWDSDRKLRSN